VLAIVAIGAGGWVAWQRTGTGFLPVMDEGAFVLDFFLPSGTSLEETDAVARKIDHILETTKAVESFTRRTGAEMGPAAATQQNRGDILVRLKPRGDRPPIDQVMDEVRDRAHAAAHQADIEFVQVLQDVLDDLSGNPRPIEIKIFGPDPKVLADLARDVGGKLEGLGTIEDLFSGIENEVPSRHVEVRPRVAAGFGLGPNDIAADLEASLAGRLAGHVRVGDRNLGVRVRMPDEVRFSPAELEALPLGYGPTPVALGTLADLRPVAGPSALTRENLRPVLIMTAAVNGSDLGGATADVARRVAEVKPPDGYTIEVGGQAESARQTQRDLLGVFGMGIALILAILLVQLGSLRTALVVLLGAPLALVGAVVTLLVTGIPLNASSLMGCVLLAGLVVKNGILLLERAEREAEAGVDYAEALARAGARRLRPIIMTTAATIVGLFPLALGLGAGAELQRPLAVATIGGLVLSTLVTLFAVPALAYALAGKRRHAAK
jgi:multidrug efflux pump subunit AcrB